MIDVAVLLLPLLFLVAGMANGKSRPAFAGLALYIYPLVVLVMTATPGYAMPAASVSESVGDVLRGLVHVANLCMLGTLAIWRGRLNLANSNTLRIALGAAVLMVVSVMIAGTRSNEILRAGLLMVVAINVLVLTPSAVRGRADEFLQSFTRGYYAMMVGVVVVSVYVALVHGPYPPWTTRLGRPLNPRVLSELLVVAIVLVTVYSNRIRWCIPLIVVVVATGSRLSLATIGAFLLAFAWSRRRFLLGGTLAAAMALVLIVLLSGGGGARFARTEMFAGRLLLWADAAAQVPDQWAWGIGERFVILQGNEDDPLLAETRLHNGPLEALVSYGLWFALATVGLYLAFAFRLGSRIPVEAATERMRFAALWLLLIALAESLIGTAFWTNLGDAFSLSVLLVVAVAAAEIRALRRGSSRPHAEPAHQ